MTVQWGPLIAAIILPYVGGFAGGFITGKNIDSWYKHLNIPPWNPPNWVFGPVWTCLYGMMGYASYDVWYNGDYKQGAEASGAYTPETNKHIAMSLYILQLIVNWSWTPVFFYFHRVKYAMIVIILLDILVLLTTVQFFRASYLAGGLLVPYCIWLGIATSLNVYIWKYNGDHPQFSEDKDLMN